MSFYIHLQNDQYVNLPQHLISQDVIHASLFHVSVKKQAIILISYTKYSIFKTDLKKKKF
jgi:hypothetical protein